MLAAEVPTMLIEIFSDIVCPWCYIGKRRLDAVLAEPDAAGVEVVWRPYQLYPGVPADGMPRDEFMRARFGDGARAGDVYRRILGEAEGVGLDLHFDRIERAPNTLRAHRLMSWAEPSGRQHALAEALFSAYFREGRDVGDPAELAALATQVGLDGTGAAAMLATDDETDKVRAELDLGRSAGIEGVPCFVLAGRFAIPGAQPVDVMRQLIARARERLVEASPS
jgi:predicted DsbA family dithiol-disulfide isomerase